MKKQIAKKSMAIFMIAGISTSFFPNPHLYAAPSEVGHIAETNSTATTSWTTVDTTSTITGSIATNTTATENTQPTNTSSEETSSESAPAPVAGPTAPTTTPKLTLSEIVTRLQAGDDTLTFKDLQDAMNIDEIKISTFTNNPVLETIFKQIIQVHPDVDNWPKVGDIGAKEYILQNSIEAYRNTLGAVTRAMNLMVLPQGIALPNETQITLPLVQAYAEDDFVWADSNRQQLAGLTDKGKQTLVRNNGILEIPNTATTILSNAFKDNQDIKQLSYQANPKLKTINESAFEGANRLTNVIIANTVTSIGSSAFRAVSNINLSFQENSILRVIENYAFSMPANVNSSRQIVLENKILYKWEEYATFPDTLEYIGVGAFQRNGKHTKLYFPDSVTYIGSYSFYDWRIEKIRLSNNLTVIEEFSFNQNRNLTEAIIPEGVHTIKTNAFWQNSLTRVTFPNTLITIENSAFSNNFLKEVSFPDSLKTIWDLAFNNNKLTNITIPASITSVWNNAFSNNSIYKLRSETTGVTKQAFGGQRFDPKIDTSHTPFQAINYVNDKEVPIRELTKLADAYMIVGDTRISLNDYVKVTAIRSKSTGQSIPLDNLDASIDPGDYDITFDIDMKKLDYQPADLQNHPGITKTTTLYGYNVPRETRRDNEKYFPYTNTIRKPFGTAVTADDVRQAVQGLPTSFPKTNDQRFKILTTTLPDGQTAGKNPDVQVRVVYDDDSESEIVLVPVIIGDAPLPDKDVYNPIGTQTIKKYGENVTPDEVKAKIFGLPRNFPSDRLTITSVLPTGEQIGTHIVNVTVNYLDDKWTDTVQVKVIVEPPKSTILNVGSLTFGYGDNITADELKKHAVAIISDDNNAIIDDRANIVVDMSQITTDARTEKVEPGNYNVTYTYKKVGYETKTVQSVVRVIKNADEISVRDIIHGTTTPDNSQGKPGDMYVNTVTGDVYIKRDNNQWPAIHDFNMKGQKGETGATGATGAQGEKGETGTNGLDGKSAYEVWRDLTDNTGAQPNKDKTEEEYIASLKGQKGDTGATGATGAQGEKWDKGETGATGAQWDKGDTGKSAYEVWRDMIDNTGNQPNKDKTENDFIESLKWAQGETGAQGEKGEAGANGKDGSNGRDGVDGKSAYEIWRGYTDNNGNQPNKDKTKDDFFESLKWAKGDKGDRGSSGSSGDDGKSAYEIWRDYVDPDGHKPYEGKTEKEFLDSLKWDKGEKWNKGEDGFSFNSAPNNFLLPSQWDLETTGINTFKLAKPLTNQVCEQIVKMKNVEDLVYVDIEGDFKDDISALGMFRGIFKNENLIEKPYDKDGVVLNREYFLPYQEVTRAEYVKMLVRSLACRYEFLGTNTGFPDVETNMWYAEYIKFAVENGWINGYADGDFRPNNFITRDEAAKILSRAIGLEINKSISETNFTDIEKNSEFIPYIETLKKHGIMKGKNEESFEPKSYIPRHESARVIYRTFFGGKS